MKATKFDLIFQLDMTEFCGILRKPESSEKKP